MNPTNEHREQARGCTRLQDCASMTHWSDCKSNHDKYPAAASEIAHKHVPFGVVLPHGLNGLVKDIASALSSRDREVREVLEGVLEFCDQVIEVWEIRPTPTHRVTLQRARALYTKLQPKQ